MIVNPELFVIPNKDNFILYLPLEKRSALEVTPGVLSILKNASSISPQDSSDGLVKKLIGTKVIVPEDYKIMEFPKKTQAYLPTSVTLLPTTDCNLNCIYCYASSGEHRVNMPFDTAKASIDFITENALKLGQKNIGVSFHGGGEPFMNYKLIKEAVKYSKSLSKKKRLKSPHYSIVTNAVLNQEQLNFLKKYNFRVNISLDGTKDIQDFQRPLRDGRSSFEQVMNSIRFMEENKQNYGIRSTITNYNLGRLKEIVDFFKDTTNLDTVHFEPVFECGRCEKTNTTEPDSKEFLEKILEAKEYGLSKGMGVYYSGGRFDATTNHFCGATGSNFIVTPYGTVTTCLEVSTTKDPRSSVFQIGKQNKGSFQIEQDKIDYLKSRTVDKMSNCTDCYAKYNCAGDCLAKVLAKGSLFDTSENSRCDINRGVLLYEINKKLNESTKQDNTIEQK